MGGACAHSRLPLRSRSHAAAPTHCARRSARTVSGTYRCQMSGDVIIKRQIGVQLGMLVREMDN